MKQICKAITEWWEALKLKTNKEYRKSNDWVKEAAQLLSEFMDAESAVAYAHSLYDSFVEYGDTPAEAVAVEMSYWDD